MLIQPDRNELGDKRLDPKEGVAQKREECIALAGTRRLAVQDDLEDPTRTMGPRLQVGEFVARLKRIAPSVIFRDSYVTPVCGDLALYAPRTAKELEDATRAWQNDKDTFFLHHKYVGGFPKKEIHEYSGLDVEEYTRLANKEIRGWRSILIMLLQQGLTSYRTVVDVFGDVGTDRRGWRWREATQKWRDNPEVKFAN
jgi:hypothetical protein